MDQSGTLHSSGGSPQPAALDAARVLPGRPRRFDDLAGRDGLAILAIAATPTAGRQLSRSKIAATLRRAGRQRRIDQRAVEIQTALRAEQLTAPTLIADAMGTTITALVAVITELQTQISRLEAELADRFEQHPDAEIVRSLPGLGMTLGARVLGEFGDDPNRYATAKCRKNYSGMSPITRPPASTTSCWPATPVTDASLMPAPCGRSPHSRPVPAIAPTTTHAERPATPTTAPYEPSATASSVSSTAASATTPPTTNTPPGHTWDV